MQMIILLVLGLALLMVLAYKGVPIILATIISATFILITAGMNLYDGLTQSFATGMGGYFAKYFLIFLFGALFGKVCEIGGATDSIARGVVKKFGAKYIVVAIIIAGAILSYGGVNLFVALFALYPLAMSLFKQADIPRRLFPAAYVSGVATFSMSSPFTPAIQNIIPTQYLGTDVTAGAVPGVISSLFLAAGVIWYMQHQVKKAKEKGEHFVPRDTDKAVLNEAEAEMKETKLPSVIVALLPMIVLLAALNIVKTSVITALFLGIVAGLIFYYPYLPHSLSELWKHGSKASTDATTAIVNTSAAVGFGSVVATTPAFQTAITAVTGIGGNPLIAAGLATTALAGIAGSASGGLGIAVPIIKEYFLPLGVNPEALHRVMVVACGGLDSLPHNGFVITLLTYSGLTHKEAYKDIGITTMLLPLISLAILIALFYFIPGWM
jgi:H+/gluconate symporter-like permease